MRRSTCGRTARASSEMARPTTVAAAPNASAQRNIAPVGCSKAGSPGSASENVPKPVSESSPMKMSVPIPAASRPGSSTTPSIAPPRPDASRSRKAPSSGDPSSDAIAAKLPAAAITAAAAGGASRAASRTARTPSPLPIKMSGASGPSTTPKPSVPRAASAMPGSWAGGTAPAGWKPSAGECPPVPGSARIARPTSSPDSMSTGSGHHAGGEEKPRASGTSWNTRSDTTATSLRNPYATADTGTPMSAARSEQPDVVRRPQQRLGVRRRRVAAALMVPSVGQRAPRGVMRIG